jgi:hypothetical protein
MNEGKEGLWVFQSIPDPNSDLDLHLILETKPGTNKKKKKHFGSTTLTLVNGFLCYQDLSEVTATLLGCDETGQEAEQFQPLLHTASALFHLLPRVISLGMLKVLVDEILDLWFFSSEVSHPLA